MFPLAGILVLGLGLYALFATGNDDGGATLPRSGGATSPSAKVRAGQLDLPHGVLPPALGPPRGTSTPLCDEASGAGVSELIREVGDVDVVVAEPDWQRMGASTRTGIASWLSKCKRGGRPIGIRGSDSGELLATYDAETGYHAAR